MNLAEADFAERGQAAYRVPAPSADALIAWPESFGKRFAIHVDTEEEFDWSAPFSRDGHDVAAASALPEAHRRFVDQGAFVTYLVDYPIAARGHAVQAIRSVLQQGSATVGTQLHPWVNPPFDEVVGVANSFAGNLPVTLEAAKLDALTGAIEGAFDVRPIVYRAGRYGIGPATLRLLAERGYRIDSSVRSGYDYSAQAGPDFRAVGNRAFRSGPAGSMIELPLTSVHIGRLRRGGRRLYAGAGRIPYARGFLARTGMLRRIALTPEDMPLGAALEAIRVAAGDGARLLNFSYHSPSLAPGYTPYVRDAADLAAFWRWWDDVLSLLAKLGIASASPAQIVDAAGMARDESRLQLGLGRAAAPSPETALAARLPNP